MSRCVGVRTDDIKQKGLNVWETRQRVGKGTGTFVEGLVELGKALREVGFSKEETFTFQHGNESRTWVPAGGVNYGTKRIEGGSGIIRMVLLPPLFFSVVVQPVSL